MKSIPFPRLTHILVYLGAVDVTEKILITCSEFHPLFSLPHFRANVNHLGRDRKKLNNTTRYYRILRTIIGSKHVVYFAGPRP